MDLNEENIIQILGEFLVSEGFQYYGKIQEIFSCLSDEDWFLKSEPPYKSLQLIHAFLTAISSPQTYICELIEQQHYEILALHLQLNKFTDNQLKQIVYDKLKGQSNDYKQIFLLQRLERGINFYQQFKNYSIDLFNHSGRDLSLVSESSISAGSFCKEVQQQKLMKLLILIKQQNQQVGIQLQWAIYEVYEQMGCTMNPPELESMENTQTKVSFRLYYVKQKFMQNIKQLSTLIREVEEEQRDNFKLYTQWQLQL